MYTEEKGGRKAVDAHYQPDIWGDLVTFALGYARKGMKDLRAETRPEQAQQLSVALLTRINTLTRTIREGELIGEITGQLAPVVFLAHGGDGKDVFFAPDKNVVVALPISETLPTVDQVRSEPAIPAWEREYGDAVIDKLEEVIPSQWVAQASHMTFEI